LNGAISWPWFGLAPSEGRAKVGFRFLDDEEIQSLPRPEWLIERLIPSHALALMYGQPGLGKTFLALDWAFHVATGKAWQGRQTKRGEVVYVAAEGAAGMGPRVRAWKQRYGVEGCAGVHFLPEPLLLLQPDTADSFAHAVRQVCSDPAMVVIDTLARCITPGDENSPKDMGLFVAAADKIRVALNCTVLPLHHPTKASPVERGHGALRGAADCVMELRKAGAGMVLKCDKQKDGPLFEDLCLRLDAVDLGNDENSCVCAATDATAGLPDRVNESEARALRSLEAFPKGATSGAWRKASGLPERTFHNVVERCHRADRISSEGTGRNKVYRVKLPLPPNCQDTASAVSPGLLLPVRPPSGGPGMQQVGGAPSDGHFADEHGAASMVGV
jgi:hypothetical protein